MSGTERNYEDEDGQPIPPDNWDEETQSFIDEDEDEGGDWIPGESPDPYWFNE